MNLKQYLTREWELFKEDLKEVIQYTEEDYDVLVVIHGNPSNKDIKEIKDESLRLHGVKVKVIVDKQ